MSGNIIIRGRALERPCWKAACCQIALGGRKRRPSPQLGLQNYLHASRRQRHSMNPPGPHAICREPSKGDHDYWHSHLRAIASLFIGRPGIQSQLCGYLLEDIPSLARVSGRDVREVKGSPKRRMRLMPSKENRAVLCPQCAPKHRAARQPKSG